MSDFVRPVLCRTPHQTLKQTCIVATCTQDLQKQGCALESECLQNQKVQEKQERETYAKLHEKYGDSKTKRKLILTELGYNHLLYLDGELVYNKQGRPGLYEACEALGIEFGFVGLEHFGNDKSKIEIPATWEGLMKMKKKWEAKRKAEEIEYHQKQLERLKKE